MKVLITGATGKLGSIVTQEVLKRLSPSEVAVSVRDITKAEALIQKGIDVRQGDFDQPESLINTFTDIDRLLIISTTDDNDTRIRQHKNAVYAAKQAGVGYILYTSIAKADDNILALAQVHRVTEDAIRSSGIPYAILRNNWYLENESGNIQGALAGAPWVTNYGDGKVAWSTRSEYAEAAAQVLCDTSMDNRIYELSGPLHTHEDLVQTLSELIGKSITIQQVDDVTYGQNLASVGLPDFLVPIIVEMGKSIREGALEVESTDLGRVLGHEPAPLSEKLKNLMSSLGN